MQVPITTLTIQKHVKYKINQAFTTISVSVSSVLRETTKLHLLFKLDKSKMFNYCCELDAEINLKCSL